jgi:hypothetical protein
MVYTQMPTHFSQSLKPVPHACSLHPVLQRLAAKKNVRFLCFHEADINNVRSRTYGLPCQAEATFDGCEECQVSKFWDREFLGCHLTTPEGKSENSNPVLAFELFARWNRDFSIYGVKTEDT